MSTSTDGSAFILTSPAFESGQVVPARYTCEDADISPPLQWTDPPAGTKSFALIVDDPDAPRGTWVHWVLYGLPPNTRSLPEGVPPDAELPDGSKQGRNSFGDLGYGGPCPPRGHGPHRYFFKLYALSQEVDRPSGASAEELENAIRENTLARAELMGTYSRQPGA